MKKRSKAKLVLINWLAIYPTITVILFLLEPFLSHITLPVKTFILTIIAVPVMVYVAVPLVQKILSDHKDEHN